MAVAQPISMTSAAWRAIGSEVLEPALQAASPADLPGLVALASAWRAERTSGSSTTVWLTVEQVVTLAGLLDSRPELAGALG